MWVGRISGTFYRYFNVGKRNEFNSPFVLNESEFPSHHTQQGKKVKCTVKSIHLNQRGHWAVKACYEDDSEPFGAWERAVVCDIAEGKAS